MEGIWTLITAVAGKIIIWVAIEVLLNLVGLDNLADYSEYVFEQGCDNPVAIAPRSSLPHVKSSNGLTPISPSGSLPGTTRHLDAPP